MATLSLQTITLAGITPSYAAVAAGGDKFANNGDTWVHIKNSSGVNAYTVTFTTTRSYKGVLFSGMTLTVGTNGDKKCGPFPPFALNDSNEDMNITYTGSAPATDLTIAVLKAPIV